MTPTNDSSKAANEISSQFSVNMKMLVSEAKSFTSSRGAYSITANPNSLQIPLAKKIDSRLTFHSFGSKDFLNCSCFLNVLIVNL